jgi:solute carrier family 45 protein 1/2/4
MNGVGNIFGMFCGGVNLPKFLPFLGNTQFKVLCAIASISMLVTAGISCASIQERDPTLESAPTTDDSLLGLFKDLARSFQQLPPQIMRVCEVQFLAWIGWFPFLFYTTTYIAEMYVDPIYEANPNLSREEADKIWEAGTRRGTFALLIFAIITFTSSVLLPFIIPPTYQAPITMANRSLVQPLTPTAEGLMSGSGYFPLKRPSKNEKSTIWTRLSLKLDFLLSHLQIKSLTLRRAWLLSHIVFAICMAMTFVVSGTTSATILVAIIGIPWSLTQWAPFALISAEISKRDAIRRGIIRAPATTEGNLQAADEDSAVHQAGVVLGIHNVAISAPQVLATLISSVIFNALAKPRGVSGDNSVAWCMRFGGLCALVAAWLTSRVHEDRIVKKNGGAVVIEED